MPFASFVLSMPSAATLNRAARLLALITPRDPADAVLRRELRPRRDLAPAERRDIVRAIAAYFRWLGWLDKEAPPQRRLEAALALQARFDANPAAVKPEALAARTVPEWIWAELPLAASEPADPAAEALAKADWLAPQRWSWLRQLQRDPPLWIRARQEFASTLPRALGDCEPAHVAGLAEAGPGSAGSTRSRQAPPATTALRYKGSRVLFLTREFQQGQFEIQDLASQLVGHACAPQPGETWWDACAGEGGKTLHLADLMRNQGLIWASDRSVRRLQILKKRAARAQVFNYRTVAWNGGPQPPTRTKFDGVLVDAPCSGVGTWQRHPHARWTMSSADVRELAARQSQLLEHVAGSIKPGGCLVYAVCTLTRTETTGVAGAFTAAHPEFAPAAVFPVAGVADPGLGSTGPGAEYLWPHVLNANGMFIALWKRK
ncbi:MAG: RsmB/NOP family class I SAM-dependent RNA methyltransferase [Opitutaceae bacterium]|nr:RsmB/NOP family class I SAM-dependent RNA methyltransferase [Opitutaceae bacterium]